MNEFLGYCTGDHLALLAAVCGLEEGWTDHHPRGATCVSELKVEAMGGLALAGVARDRRRVDLALAGGPQCRAGVGKT